MWLEVLKNHFLGVKNKGVDLGPRSQMLVTPGVDPTLPDAQLAVARREERKRLRHAFSELRSGKVRRLYSELSRAYIERREETLLGLYRQVISDEDSTYTEQVAAWNCFRRTLCESPLLFRKRLSREAARKR